MLINYKITLLGDGMVGKTSLCSRFMGKAFPGDYLTTMGADICLKTIKVRSKSIQLQIWDIAGQPFFHSIRHTYFRGAIGALYVFDVSRSETLENASDWIRELWKHNEQGVVPVVILGNKIDLRESLVTTVTSEEGQALAQEYSKSTQELGFGVPYLETSAKSGENVEQAFILLVEEIIEFVDRELQR